MKIDLVFYDWVEKGTGASVFGTKRGMKLSLGDFHTGTVFHAEIELEDYQGEFEAAAEKGVVPLFYVLVKGVEE